MKTYTIRLERGEDLRKSLLEFAKEKGIKAGFIITCVGSLSKSVLRMAGAIPEGQSIKEYGSNTEIVSLVGTITDKDCHLHIALSNSEGKVFGGHLKEGSVVDTTAEIVIGEDESVTYLREYDENTGFDELEVKLQ